MKTDLPPWKEDPNNPTRKSSEKRKDKYGNEIKNVAKHLARKAMNAVKEAVNKYPREGFPEEGDYGYHPNPGLKPQESDSDEDMDVAYKKATEKEGRKPLNAKITEHDNCGTPECCGQCDTAEIKEGVTNPEIKKAYADLIKTPGGSAERKSAIRRYKSLRQNAVKEEVNIDKYADMLIKRDKQNLSKSHVVHAARVAGVDHKKLMSAVNQKVGRIKEESELEEAHGMWKVDFPKQHAGKAVAAGSVHVKAQNTAHAHKVAAKRVGVDHKVFKSKVTKSSILPEEVEGKVYSVHVKGDSKEHNTPEFKKHVKGWGGELHYASDKGAAYKFKKEYQATGFHHGVKSGFKSLDSEHDGHVKEGYMPTSDQPTDANKKTADKIRALFAKEKKTVKEELGKSNEWGTDALRKKYAAATPGQEGLTAKNIPTFDARYDDVPTQYCGGIQKEETLTEISAKGAIARDKFKARIQQVLNDPKAIAKAKKTIAKKKAAEADAPKNLVHQLHKSQSINAKVKFYDGKEHEIAPNHHDKFMNKYHGLKSSIEKEALVSRAHKSHSEFLKAIHEEWVDFSQEKPSTDSITPANYPKPPIHDDMTDYNNDDRHDEYDTVAIENDVAAEIETAEWEDLIDYYEDEDLDYEDSEEDIAEGISPQGRLKKRFNMMRTKGRRNLARNMALKRVATPDRIKSRSVRAARNMVYSRVLRGRDRSTLSASEKSRIEGMVKRMAPMVGRLSIRLQQKERMIDRKRINNRNKRKKK